ncbi:MAG: LysR substrate-binding domain-containing protein [Lautropia sp.]|nr:LysR substrate-binding domain-containing protein [Lautropia sp.]
MPLISHFKAHLPQARLEIVEGFSSHMEEWLISGRVDLCLLYNPNAHLSLEITPLMQDRLCLVGRQGSLPSRQHVNFSELPGYPLIIAQRGQIFRTLMEAQATLSGVTLDIAWEVSSVPVILDLLRSGHGHAVLAESALSSHQRDSDAGLEARLIRQPKIHCTLCLAQRGHFRETLLMSKTKQALQQVMHDTAMRGTEV